MRIGKCKDKEDYHHCSDCCIACETNGNKGFFHLPNYPTGWKERITATIREEEMIE